MGVEVMIMLEAVDSALAFQVVAGVD